MEKIEGILKSKIESFISSKKSVRRDKVIDVFKRRYLIPPRMIDVVNYPRKPVAVFNPGALLKDGKVYVFPRLVFDYYKYVSSIGVFEIDLEDLLLGKLESRESIEVKIILWPQHLWEFLGCEDPRVMGNGEKIYMVYTGKGNTDDEKKKRDVVGFAKFDGKFNLIFKEHLKICNGMETFYPKSVKDSAFVRIENDEAVILTRIHLNDHLLGWVGRCDMDKSTIIADSLKPVLAPEDWETKVGWSTNVVKISDGEYLVGWHSVLKRDLSYRNGFAIINDRGDLVSISDYMLVPTGLQEEYGDRALVIFGDGLIRYENFLIWIGGVGDYAIGVFIADFDNVIRNMRDL